MKLQKFIDLDLKLAEFKYRANVVIPWRLGGHRINEATVVAR